MPEGYMTTEQVAKLKGVTRGCVVQWIHKEDNPLPAEKFNQVWVIRQEDAYNYKPAPIPGRPKKTC